MYVFFTVITGLIGLAHRTNDMSNITAFGSHKSEPWYEMENVSDINLKHEQYEEHWIVLYERQSQSYMHNFWFVPTLHEPVGIKDGVGIRDVCKNKLLPKIV